MIMILVVMQSRSWRRHGHRVIIGFDGMVRKIASALTSPAALDRDLGLGDQNRYMLRKLRSSFELLDEHGGDTLLRYHPN